MNGSELIAGVKVLEIAEGVIGPMCGKVLGDLGAGVTKIERPEGDWLRRVAPGDDGDGALYPQLNADKDILRLDLSQPAAQSEVVDLVRTVDICVVGHRGARLASLGLQYESLRQANPGLVYCLVSGWGSGGPMGDQAASELCVQAVAGLTRYLGSRGGPPVRQGLDLVSVDTGIAAAQGALAALLWRARTGEGQFVEVSMLATAIALMQWDIAAESGPDEWQGRQLDAHEWPPDHGFQCADARCLIDLRGTERGWPGLLRDIGCHDLADDPRFNTLEGLDLHVTELPRLTAGRLSSWPFVDLERLVRDEYGGTIVPVLDLAATMNHPQVRHINVITETDRPRVRLPIDVVETR